MTTTHVQTRKIRSPLLEALTLERFNPKSRANGRRRQKKIVAALVLTSLVDAFSIMLLYLLVQNSGNGSTLELMGSAKLPIATEATALHEGTLVRVEGGRFVLDNQTVEESALAQKLQEVRARSIDANEAPSLIVQADRDSGFDRVAAVIRAGSVSGFHQFKFAVLQGESGR